MLFPMTLITPDDALVTPCDPAPVPAVILPEIVNVPVFVFDTATKFVVLPPIALATNDAAFGLVSGHRTAGKLAFPPITPVVAVAVSVMPFVRSNVPPAATTGEASVRLLTVSTVYEPSTVTVKLLLRTSSAVVGNDPVFHTVASDQFPDLVA